MPRNGWAHQYIFFCNGLRSQTTLTNGQINNTKFYTQSVSVKKRTNSPTYSTKNIRCWKKRIRGWMSNCFVCGRCCFFFLASYLLMIFSFSAVYLPRNSMDVHVCFAFVQRFSLEHWHCSFATALISIIFHSLFFLFMSTWLYYSHFHLPINLAQKNYASDPEQRSRITKCSPSPSRALSPFWDYSELFRWCERVNAYRWREFLRTTNAPKW